MTRLNLKTFLLISIACGCVILPSVWHQFRFRQQPIQGRVFFAEMPDTWRNIIEKLAEDANLALSERPPPGLSPVLPNRADGWTVREAIDVINQHLVDEGYQLVLRNQILFVVDVDNLGGPEPGPPLVVQSAIDILPDSKRVTVLFDDIRVSQRLLERIKSQTGGDTELHYAESARQLVIQGRVDQVKIIRDAIKKDSTASR